MTNVSKILEITNCNKELLLQVIYKEAFWERVAPIKNISVKFVSPNVLYSKIEDELPIVKLLIETEGELVLSDRGEEVGKGRLIEFNVRNNKEIKELEGRFRIKEISPQKSKLGIFVDNFSLEVNFLKIIGSAAEFILQTKITDLLRNLERYCKTNDLKNFLNL